MLQKQIALLCVYGQLVLVTGTLAAVQSSNESHQFSNGPYGRGTLSCVRMHLSDLYVLQLVFPGLHSLLPEG